MNFFFLQLATEQGETAAGGPLVWSEAACPSLQLQLLEDAINTPQGFLTIFVAVVLARSKGTYYSAAARRKANGAAQAGVGVTLLRNSFSRTPTCRTMLGDLSIKPQHALQKNCITQAPTERLWPLKSQLCVYLPSG